MVHLYCEQVFFVKRQLLQLTKLLELYELKAISHARELVRGENRALLLAQKGSDILEEPAAALAYEQPIAACDFIKK